MRRSGAVGPRADNGGRQSLVTSRDVAKAAGVSQATVSRVLSNHPSVSPATRTKVEAAFKKLGYEPNGPARAMRTNRTGTIGIVVSRIDNPFYPELLQAISRELDGLGRRMTVWNAQGPGEKSAADAVRQRLVDGVIFTTATEHSEPLDEALANSSPVVLVNRTLKGATCDQIESDSIEGARRIVHYFARAGHRDIAMIGGVKGISTSEKRLKGFRKGLKEVGIEWNDRRHRRADFTHDTSEKVFMELMQGEKPPTAIFCMNDVTAFGAIDGARKLGVRVPEDLWVVGYDGIAMSSWAAFDLTTVRQPIQRMARMAIRCLLDRIEGTAPEPKLYQVEPEIVVRGSTANTPLEDD
ncbi:MAG: LacI family DNA-binding transcriptional regulator [Bauldia sp.]|nr:LacI family DNA-binding transcriptional regulator [Bauldia sp.]